MQAETASVASWAVAEIEAPRVVSTGTSICHQLDIEAPRIGSVSGGLRPLLTLWLGWVTLGSGRQKVSDLGLRSRHLAPSRG